MDRLLYKESDGDITCRSRDFDKVFPTLYAYEETGLTPEEIEKMRGEMKTAYDEHSDPYMLEATGSEAIHIAELLSAEANGRLIVLPCPIGTPVYVHRYLCSGLPRGQFNGDCMFAQDCPRHGAPCPEEVREEKFNLAMREGLGKWFWLTRDAAEAALPPERRNRK